MNKSGQETETKPTSFIPNSFCTPNEFVDQLMHLLQPNEWVVLSFVCRHIFGWKDKIASRTAAISLSMLKDGFTTEKGEHYHGCGLSHPAIVTALNSLTKYNILEKEGDATQKGQKYHIPEDDEKIDYAGLQQRISDKASANQKRTAKARGVINDKRLGGQSDQLVVSPTNHQELVPLTKGGQSDQHNHKHIKPSQNQDIPKPKVSEKQQTKQPSKDQCLKDALAIYWQGASPHEATGYTGQLSARVGHVWIKHLKIDVITAEQYIKIARSIVPFVEWMHDAYPGIHGKLRNLDGFEDYYREFVSLDGKPKPKTRDSDYVVEDSDDSNTWLDFADMVA